MTVRDFSPDGRLLAIRLGRAFECRFSLYVWEPATGRTLLEITDYGSEVHTARFTPDGRWLLIAGLKEVRVWDVARKHFGRSLPAPGVHSLVCSPGGKYLATQRPSGPNLLPYFARLWDLTTGKEVLAPRPAHAAEVDTVAFSPDGRTLASGSAGRIRQSVGERAEGEVLFWDARTGRPMSRCDVAPGQPGKLAFMPKGKLLAGVRNWHTPRLLEVDPATGKVLRTTPERDLLALSPDGRRMLCQEQKGKEAIVMLRDCQTGREVWRQGGERFPFYAGFLSAGERFVTARTVTVEKKGEGNGGIAVVEILATATGKRLGRWTKNRISLGVPPYPGGRLLAEIMDDLEVRMLDLETGRTSFLTRAGPRQYCWLFSPDGGFLAMCHGNRICLWELATMQEMHAFGDPSLGPSGATPLAFSPDGRRLVSVDNTDLLVWDVFEVEAAKGRLTEDASRRCWRDLALPGGPAVYQAMRTLLGRPEQAAAFLGKRLAPVPALDPADVRRWLFDLGAESFKEREKASQHLEGAGDVVESELCKALAARPELEVAHRIRAVLATINPVRATGDRLRMLRGIQVLERLGTPAARDVLTKLAGGAPGARPTRAAREALARLLPAK